MGAAASSATTAPRIVLDPDADVGWATRGGVTLSEGERAYVLGTKVRDRLIDDCGADVLVTRRYANEPVSRATRANIARNYNPDITVTLAFNATDGLPWGGPSTGGPLAWGRSAGSGDVRLAQSLLNQIGAYTHRYSTRPVNPNATFPYHEFDVVPGTVVHLETMFLDHNYDWPWVSTDAGMDTIADAVYAGLLDEMAAQGLTCPLDITYPEPPSAEELQHYADLGRHNQHVYGADPVNLSTGNFVTQEDVFSLTGVGDQVIDLSLAYNALDGRASQVGNGWNFAYSSRAQLYSTGAAMVVLADGRSVFFESDGAGGFAMPPGARSTLTAVEGGAVLTFGDGTSLEFAFDEVTGYGTLVRAEDRQGNAYELEYGPACRGGRGRDRLRPPPVDHGRGGSNRGGPVHGRGPHHRIHSPRRPPLDARLRQRGEPHLRHGRRGPHEVLRVQRRRSALRHHRRGRCRGDHQRLRRRKPRRHPDGRRRLRPHHRLRRGPRDHPDRCARQREHDRAQRQGPGRRVPRRRGRRHAHRLRRALQPCLLDGREWQRLRRDVRRDGSRPDEHRPARERHQLHLQRGRRPHVDHEPRRQRRVRPPRRSSSTATAGRSRRTSPTARSRTRPTTSTAI